MKNLKKILSLIMAFSLLASISAGIDFSAFANGETVVGIRAEVPDENAILYEGVDGYDDSDPDGEYFRYNFNYWQKGNAITLLYDDESEDTYYFDDNAWGFYNEDGDCLDDEYYTTSIQSSRQAWSVGKHVFTICYKDFSDDFDVEIVKNPVTDFSVVLASPIEVFENSNGEWDFDDNNEEFFNYYTGISKEGNKIVCTTSNGNVEYTCTEVYNEERYCYENLFLDKDGNEIPRFTIYNDQYDQHWTVGTNYLRIKVMGITKYVPVTVLPSPNEVVLEGIPVGSAFENTNGEWLTDENEEEYYRYYTPGIWQEGATISLVFDDHTDVYTCTEVEIPSDDDVEWTELKFFDKNGKEFPGSLYTENNQDEEHWTVGTNYYSINIAGIEKQLEFVVLEVPSSIELTFADKNATILREGVDGYNHVDEDENEYFRYDIPSVFEEGNTITLHFKNSDDITYTCEVIYDEEYDDYYPDYVDENGERIREYISIDDHQAYDNQWSVGTNYATLWFGELEGEIAFTVLPGPTGMEISFPDDYEPWAYENTRGYMTVDEETEEEFYCYDIHSGCLYQEGVTITLTYEDEDDEVYVATPGYDEEEGFDYIEFLTEDGKLLDAWNIDIVTDQSYNNQWGVGEHKATARFGKVSAEIPFNVVYNPVESVSMNIVQPIKITEKTNCETYEDEEGREIYYYNYFGYLAKEGNTITVNFKNGTSAVYTGQIFEPEEDDNFYYWYVGDGENKECFWFFDEEGNPIEDEFELIDYQNDEPWGVGNHTIDGYYMGAHFTINAQIVPAKNGWVQENKKWYYYKDGVALKYRQKINGKWYYFNGAGVMQTGWIKGGTWMYAESDGALKTGWQKIGSKWYYFTAEAAMVTGWQKLGGKWYYFNASGAMQTGWQKLGGKWYYFNASGAMQTGWQKLGGKWYYFESSGVMRTAALRQGKKTYKFNSSGVCLNP